MAPDPSWGDFHLGEGWLAPWRAAYLPDEVRVATIGGVPLVAEHAWLGPVRYRRVRSQTNLQTARLDIVGDPEADLATRIMGWVRADVVTIEYVAPESPLLAMATRWGTRHRVTVTPQAAAPAVDCRDGYDMWFAARTKRRRARWSRMERRVVTELGMTFDMIDGREGDLPALIAEILAVEQSGWKGQEGTAVLDDPRDTLFYTALAQRAAAANALRIAVLRHEGRIVAFEYGILGGDRAYLLKVGYDERFESLSIGHVLTMLNIRWCCAEPGIAWYDKLGNGMTPAAYKLRFADTIDILYRITLYGDGWRGRLLHACAAARTAAKHVRDGWRARWAARRARRKTRAGEQGGAQ